MAAATERMTETAPIGLRPRNIGARIRRVEDRRLLTGHGMFTDDRAVVGALHGRTRDPCFRDRQLPEPALFCVRPEPDPGPFPSPSSPDQGTVPSTNCHH